MDICPSVIILGQSVSALLRGIVECTYNLIISNPQSPTSMCAYEMSAVKPHLSAHIRSG